MNRLVEYICDLVRQVKHPLINITIDGRMRLVEFIKKEAAMFEDSTPITPPTKRHPNMVFHHQRDKSSPRGGATIAMLCDDEKQVVAWAAAHCHPKDNFCKHTGREKAAGRLRSRHWRVDLRTPVPLNVFLNGAAELLDLISSAS